MSGPTDDGYHSKAVRKETHQSLALVEPHLRKGDTVLDIGCGSAYLTWALAARYPDSQVLAVDIVDAHKKPTPHFALYDGVKLPFDDASCDVVMLNFVLHHIPNETKPAVLAEVRRVCRRSLLVMEDTPRNFVDRYFNNRHGETFRKSINSTAGYGFYSQREWEGIFRGASFTVRESTRLGRFSRYWAQPYARSFFALERS